VNAVVIRGDARPPRAQEKAGTGPACELCGTASKNIRLILASEIYVDLDPRSKASIRARSVALTLGLSQNSWARMSTGFTSWFRKARSVGITEPLRTDPCERGRLIEVRVFAFGNPVNRHADSHTCTTALVSRFGAFVS
jgi:hypothetical protein